MRKRARLIGLAVGWGWGLASGLVAGEGVRLREAELHEPDAVERLEVLDLASNKVAIVAGEELEKLENEARDEKVILERLAKLGDLSFENAGGGILEIGAKDAMKYEEDDVVEALAGKAPSSLVYPVGRMLVSPEDYLLVRMVRGGYALVYVRARTEEKVKVAWIVNGGGDKPFEKDVLAKFVDAVSRDKK